MSQVSMFRLARSRSALVVVRLIKSCQGSSCCVDVTSLLVDVVVVVVARRRGEPIMSRSMRRCVRSIVVVMSFVVVQLLQP